MHRSERSIVREIVRYMKAMDWWVMKIHGSVYQPAGVPDLLCIKGGKTLFLEVKCEGGIVSKIQQVTMRKLQSAGATTAVVRSIDDVIGVISMMEWSEEVKSA